MPACYRSGSWKGRRTYQRARKAETPRRAGSKRGQRTGLTQDHSSQTFRKQGSLLARRSPPRRRLRSARACPRLGDVTGISFHLKAHRPSSTPGEELVPLPPPPSFPPGCTASPTEVGSPPGQAASVLGSLSEGLRRGKKQHLVLPPGASLFAGEREGAQGDNRCIQDGPGWRARPSHGPRAARRLTLRPPAQWPSPFSMVDVSRGSI